MTEKNTDIDLVKRIGMAKYKDSYLDSYVSDGNFFLIRTNTEHVATKQANTEYNKISDEISFSHHGKNVFREPFNNLHFEIDMYSKDIPLLVLSMKEAKDVEFTFKDKKIKIEYEGDVIKKYVDGELQEYGEYDKEHLNILIEIFEEVFDFIQRLKLMFTLNLV